MIEAELRSKGSSSSRDDEDLLTSAVFGLLRYVPPNAFWLSLLKQTESYTGKSLVDRCQELGIQLLYYTRLAVHFWPTHQAYGEPDILLVFSGGHQLPLCLVIEAKLSAYKSGVGQHDQLNRYLAALQDSAWLGKVTGLCGPMALPGLIYLTPRAAWSELHDSIEQAPDRLVAETSLFLLQWQDIMQVARQVFPRVDEPQLTMLSRIAEFLEHRGLAYFRGFDHLRLEDLTTAEAHCYSAEESCFAGFTETPLEPLSLADVSLYTFKRVSSFCGLSDEPFAPVTAAASIFYGGNR